MLVVNLAAMKDELGAWNAAEAIRVVRRAVDLAAAALYDDAEWQRRVRAQLTHHFAGGPRLPRVTHCGYGWRQSSPQLP